MHKEIKQEANTSPPFPNTITGIVFQGNSSQIRESQAENLGVRYTNCTGHLPLEDSS